MTQTFRTVLRRLVTPVGSPRVVAALAVLILAAFAAPIIVSGLFNGRPAMDHVNFHEPAIRIFAHDWPDLDLVGYLSATTPLYHLLLAAVCRSVDDSTMSLQFAGLGFSLALIGLFARGCSVRGHYRMALAGTLAAFSSHYLFYPAVFLLPDNLGWLGVVAAMLLALRGRVDAWTYLGGAAVLTALVATRQTHIWAAAMLWAAAWLGPARHWEDPPIPRLTDPLAARRVALALAASLPAFALLGWFVFLWKGLTPPLFRNVNVAQADDGAAASLLASVLERINPAAPVYILALFGLHAVFFAPTLAEPLLDLWRRRRRVLLGVASATAAIALLPATTHDPEYGRSLGLWRLARHAPEINGHINPAIVALAFAGSLSLAALCRRLPRRDAIIFLVGILAFTAAFATHKDLWQRYCGPFVLLTLVLMICRGGALSESPAPGTLERVLRATRRRTELVGPLALATLSLTASVMMVLRLPPEARYSPHWLLHQLYPQGGGPELIRIYPSQPRYAIPGAERPEDRPLRPRRPALIPPFHMPPRPEAPAEPETDGPPPDAPG